MARAAARLGLFGAAIAAAAAAGYDLAQLLQIIGALRPPWDGVAIFGCSLCLAPPFLLSMLAVSDWAAAERRVFGLAAVAFGAIYVGYVGLVYALQLGLVIPRSNPVAASPVLAVTPQSPLWIVDGLGYIAMGIAALFAALALAPDGPERWPRRWLMAHACVTPLITFVYFYPHFSVGVLLLGSPWALTAVAAMLSLAMLFRRSLAPGRP